MLVVMDTYFFFLIVEYMSQLPESNQNSPCHHWCWGQRSLVWMTYLQPVTCQGGNFHWFFKRIQNNSSSLIVFATRIHLIAKIYAIVRKLYYILALCCYNFWLHKDVHSHHSQVLATFFSLKTFPYPIILHNLTDMRKWYIFFPFFPLHHHQLSSIVKCPMCFLPLHLWIFRLENHFWNFGPGEQGAGSARDDSISWLWQPHLTACVSPFPHLMGTLKPQSKHNKCWPQPSLLPHWYFSWI